MASFLALAISSPKAKEFLEENAIGVTLKNLNQQVLGDLEIPLPPLEEQRRIVAEIEAEQARIRDLELQIEECRRRIDARIESVWTGDALSANGAPPYQPGATPQVTKHKRPKG